MLLKTESQNHWYLAYTKPHQEHIAAKNLEQQNFGVYLPLLKKAKAYSSFINKVNNAPLFNYEPLFPRYIFIQLTEKNRSISTIRSTRGVTSLVMFGNQLALAPPSLLATIREIENQHNNTAEKPEGALQPGEDVTIKGTSFNGLEGVVQAVSSKRVLILLDILGRQAVVKIQPQHVSLAIN